MCCIYIANLSLHVEQIMFSLQSVFLSCNECVMHEVKETLVASCCLSNLLATVMAMDSLTPPPLCTKAILLFVCPKLKVKHLMH